MALKLKRFFSQPFDRTEETLDRLLAPYHEAKQQLFVQMFKAVWGILGVYTLMYGYLGVKISFAMVALGALVLSPVNLWMMHAKLRVLSRVFFAASCNLYIYCTSLGMSHQVLAEFYYLPATMVPLLIFSSNQRKLILATILWSFGFWVATITLGADFLPEDLLNSNAPKELLSHANFIGAFLITIIFLRQLMHSNVQLLTLFVQQKDSELHRVRAAARQIEEAQAAAKIGSWQYNPKSQEFSWSKQMYQIFRQDIDGGPLTRSQFLLLIHTDDRDTWMHCIDTVGDSLLTQTFRSRVLGPRDDIWIETACQIAVDANGGVTEIHGTCQDINQRVHYENELQQERAKTLHQSKLVSLGEISAGVAHEINNPLAVVSGSLPLLSKFKDDPTKWSKKIEAMEKATQRIEKIVRGLKRFSRGHELQEKKWVDLRSIVQDAMAITEIKATRSQCPVTVHADAKPNADFSVLCDAVEMEQVIINLIHNAIDAVQSNPQRWVQVNLIDNWNSVFLQVVDSGHGISTDIEEKLFQPFFTTKPPGEGTGLGLSIVKGILDQHGFQIGLNRKFKNTCFEVAMPKAKEARNAA